MLVICFEHVEGYMCLKIKVHSPYNFEVYSNDQLNCRKQIKCQFLSKDGQEKITDDHLVVQGRRAQGPFVPTQWDQSGRLSGCL